MGDKTHKQIAVAAGARSLRPVLSAARAPLAEVACVADAKALQRGLWGGCMAAAMSLPHPFSGVAMPLQHRQGNIPATTLPRPSNDTFQDFSCPLSPVLSGG